MKLKLGDETMKFIQYILAISILLVSSSVFSLDCEVSYKAKRVVTKTHLLKEVSNPEYKVGVELGSGETIESCKDNALNPLREEHWKITYASAKET